MRRTTLLPIAVLALLSVPQGPAAAQASEIVLPEGYRDWVLISIAHVGPPQNDMRAKLGNDIAIRAYRQGKTPFPDGTILARLAWKQAPSELAEPPMRAILERQAGAAVVEKLLAESHSAGPPMNVQIMVKDAKKYASTGGWGFAQFTDGKPDPVEQKTCFACHAPGKDRDYVFTKYAP
jgi:hypothetical protein